MSARIWVGVKWLSYLFAFFFGGAAILLIVLVILRVDEMTTVELSIEEMKAPASISAGTLIHHQKEAIDFALSLPKMNESILAAVEQAPAQTVMVDVRKNRATPHLRITYLASPTGGAGNFWHITLRSRGSGLPYACKVMFRDDQKILISPECGWE